jgi:Flp pilus assembly protein TadD
VKVEDGFHLWSETYDRTLDDIFAVQDDIAHSVVKELRSALLGEAADSDASGEARAEVAQAAKGRAVNPEAHRLFLLARHLADRRSKEDTLKALQSVMEALVLDPEFALAWTELARINSTQAELGWMPVEEALGRAREAVEKALSLEPDLADAHAALAQIRMVHDWDWSGAREALDRALELEPGNARILLRAGLLASNLNRLEEAIGLYHRATELDPLRPAAWSNLGFGLYLAGRFSESEAALRKAQLLAPGNSGVCSLLALALAAQGKTEEALAEVDRETSEPFALFALAIIYGEMGRRVESDVALQDLLDRYADICGSQIATIYAARGDADAAFEWLERAYAQRDSGLTLIKSRLRLRSLHSDPRWESLLKKVGLAP